MGGPFAREVASLYSILGTPLCLVFLFPVAAIGGLLVQTIQGGYFEIEIAIFEIVLFCEAAWIVNIKLKCHVAFCHISVILTILRIHKSEEVGIARLPKLDRM